MDSSHLFRALLSLVQERNEASPSISSQHIISVPVLRQLLSAIHFRDAEILKHSRRVGLISVGIAGRLGWEVDDLRIIEVAALMHDIGKIGVPDHILRKPGKLSPDESEFIAVHHRVALALLQACHVHSNVTDIIAQSHGVDEEHLNGRSQLSLGARILAVADAYDSLTTRQAYRAPYDRWEALQILEEQCGKQFDRNVVAALGRWLDSPDAATLADERAAEVSIQVNAPVDTETRMNAAQLCQVFSHLYLLESLYDAFYVIDSDRRVVIWNSGASHLFHLPPHDVLQTKWNRQLVAKSAANTDPVEEVFMSAEPTCHGMILPGSDETYLEVDVQTIPIHSEAGQVVGVVELICNGKESKRHRSQFRSLQIAATRDSLTGVFNRGELERHMQEVHDEWTQGAAVPYSVMFMDLDHFKSINDQLSHAVGDRVLIECARMLQDELYSGELIGRYGGEEFVILCPETTSEAAMERAERLRRTLSSTRFADRDDLHVTASFGIAEIQQGESVDSVVTRADQALYDAKRQGRNRTCLSAPHLATVSSERSRSLPNHECVHSATILTYVASDMLQLKLAGFIEEHKAKIVSVTDQRLVLKLGSGGLLTGWSRNPAKRIPVTITLDLSDAPPEPNSQPGNRKMVKVTIEPIGKCTKPDEFRLRCLRIVDQLKSHLIAT